MSQFTDLEAPRRLPQVPTELLDQLQDPAVRAIIEPIVEWLYIGQGSTGNALDRLVTRRELWQNGLVRIVDPDLPVARGFTGQPDDPGLAPPEGAGQVSGDDVVPGIPTTPTGLETRGTTEHVFLKWDAPDYIGQSYTEIWRASTNSLAAAVQIANVPLDTRAYADNLGSSGITRFYWIRHVNSDNVAGNFNAGEAGGTAGSTTATPSTTEGYIAVDGADIVHLYAVTAYIADLAVTNAKIANATIEGGKITASTLTADLYAELRNTPYIHGEDSLDATFPLTIDFSILSEATDIVSVTLTYRVRPFRAYSQAGSALAGGESLNTDESNVSHAHNLQRSTGSGLGIYVNDVGGLAHSSQSLGNVSVRLAEAEGHFHTVFVRFFLDPEQSGYHLVYEDPAGFLFADIGSGQTSHTTSTTDGHTHEIDFFPGAGTGQVWRFNQGTLDSITTAGAAETSPFVSEGVHDHSLDTSDHSHAVNYGIFEEDNTGAALIDIDVSDDGSVFSSFATGLSGDQQELDMTSEFTGTGFKAIRFKSNVRARIVYDLILKLDITA